MAHSARSTGISGRHREGCASAWRDACLRALGRGDTSQHDGVSSGSLVDGLLNYLASVRVF